MTTASASSSSFSSDGKKKEKKKWEPITIQTTDVLQMVINSREIIDQVRKNLKEIPQYHQPYHELIETLRNWLCHHYDKGLKIYSSDGSCPSDRIWLAVAHLLVVDTDQSFHVFEARNKFSIALKQCAELAISDLFEALEDRMKHLILTFNHNPILDVKQDKIKEKFLKLQQLPTTASAGDTKEQTINEQTAKKTNSLASAETIPYLYENGRPKTIAGDIVSTWPLETLEYACAFVVVEYPLQFGSQFIALCARYFTWTSFFRRFWVDIPLKPDLPVEFTDKQNQNFLKWCLKQTDIKADFDYTEPYLDFLYTSYLPLGGITNYFRLRGLELKSSRKQVMFRENYEELDRTGILADVTDEILRNWMIQTVNAFQVGIAPHALQHDLHCFFLFVYNFQNYAPGVSFVDEYVFIGEECREKKETFQKTIKFQCKNGEYRPRIAIYGNEVRLKNGLYHYVCKNRCHALMLWLWLIHHEYHDTLEADTSHIGQLYLDIFEPQQS